jgi:hypothetical protein
LAALNTATNLSLTNGAMIVRQAAGAPLPSGLAGGGNLYNAYTAGVGTVTGANASLTIGATSGTPFKGIGAGRTGGYTWGTAADTLTLSGNADVVSLGSSTLTVAAKITGGAAADTFSKRGSGTGVSHLGGGTHKRSSRHNADRRARRLSQASGLCETSPRLPYPSCGKRWRGSASWQGGKGGNAVTYLKRDVSIT